MAIAILIVLNLGILFFLGWGHSAFGPRATQKSTAVDFATGDVLAEQPDGSLVSVSGSGRRLKVSDAGQEDSWDERPEKD